MLPLFIKNGVELDIENKRIREYTSIFFNKIGTWKYASDYSYYKITTAFDRDQGISNSFGNTRRRGYKRTVLVVHDRTQDKDIVIEKGELEQLRLIAESIEHVIGIPKKKHKRRQT